MEAIPFKFVEESAALIADSKVTTIVCHKNPDGDAMGSGLGLWNHLKSTGKEVYFITPNQTPAYLNWMPGRKDIIDFTGMRAKAQAILDKTDLFIMLDFNHPSRLGDMLETLTASSAKKIMIDHHPYPEDIADLMYSRVSSSSTAEMVFEFIEGLSKNSLVSTDVATCLYVGIMTDTGSFSYNSSNPLTFAVVSNLMRAGINKDEITGYVYNNFAESRLRLLGHALSHMKVIPEYKAAYIRLSQKELEQFNFEQGDTEGFVNYPLTIKGIVFSAIFIENDEFTKCSFRSTGAFPANKVSQDHFNGGGHLNAAGGQSQLSLDETIKQFERVLPEYEKYL